MACTSSAMTTRRRSQRAGATSCHSYPAPRAALLRLRAFLAATRCAVRCAVRCACALPRLPADARQWLSLPRAVQDPGRSLPRRRAAHFVWLRQDGRLHGAYLTTSPLRMRANGIRQPTAEEDKLSDLMMAQWGAFAHTGSPNGAGLPTWQSYSAASVRHARRRPCGGGGGLTRGARSLSQPATMVFNVEASQASESVHATQCALWDRTSYVAG